MYTSFKSVEDAHELFYLSHMRVSNDQTTQGMHSLVRAFTAGTHKRETFKFVIVQLYGGKHWQNRSLYDKNMIHVICRCLKMTPEWWHSLLFCTGN